MEVELVKRDGAVSMSKSFDYLCSRIPNGVYTLKITRKTKPRTLPQNALMWMWFKCLAQYSGQPKEDWHDYYTQKFLQRHICIGGRMTSVPGHTSRLDTRQMTEFLNKVQADALTEYNVTLPLPSDQFYSDFVDEYKDR